MIAGSFADAMEPIEINNRLSKFLDETDTETKDLALQLQAGDNSTDLVIRLENDDSLHLVSRTNRKEDIPDLSKSEKITEITKEDINTALETLVKMALPVNTTDDGTAK